MKQKMASINDNALTIVMKQLPEKKREIIAWLREIADDLEQKEYKGTYIVGKN